MSPRHGMLIELDRCVGCFACVTSCRETWDTGPGAGRNWVRSFETGSRAAGMRLTFYPGLCMQCEETPCVRACPTGATYTDDKGRVRVDTSLCTGCGNCVPACPYGARTVDEARGVVGKCDLCAPRVDAGLSPACVATCPADCRVFGDLDDPGSELSRRIRETAAQPLTTPALDQRPKVFFAGERERATLLAAGVVGIPRVTTLTTLWTRAANPLASRLAPVWLAACAAGGLLQSFSRRVEHLRKTEPADPPSTLHRHSLPLRLLHWFNAASWLVLLASGLALFANADFAPVGTAWPAAASSWFGGSGSLMRLHVLWGLAWGALIVPVFLLYKRSGLEALREVRLRKDDFVWLARRTLGMLGFDAGPLPEQDKYNGGQKLFALSALVLTALIIASGVVMAFHTGPPEAVSAAIAVHGAAVLALVLGLGVHIAMATLVRSEQPALLSMFTGEIDRAHAERHCARWVADGGSK